jgi:xanthine dehydrogenase YagT iron-sulfur-binding subunit
MGRKRSGSISRRDFLKTGALSVGASALTGASAGAVQDAPAGLGPGPVECPLRVNGKVHTISVDPRTTLLRALRNQLDLTGPKEVCGGGACGACTVLINGKPVVSCLMLALDARGREITTVEGLGKDGRLDEVQEAFARHDAFQCGYCTSGMILASKALLDRNNNPTSSQIKEGLCGNVCRCAAYKNIFSAVATAAKWKREGY